MARQKYPCPDCGESLRIRNSRRQHPLMQDLYYQCTNEVCGATFRGERTITHVLSPGTMTNLEHKLPTADAAMRKLAKIAEDDRQVDIEDLLAMDDDNSNMELSHD